MFSLFFTIEGVKNMRSISSITNLPYENEDCVFFRNTLQSAFYVFQGAKLVDLFVDNNMRFVFVFSKEDHHRLKLLWANSDIGK